MSDVAGNGKPLKTNNLTENPLSSDEGSKWRLNYYDWILEVMAHTTHENQLEKGKEKADE